MARISVERVGGNWALINSFTGEMLRYGPYSSKSKAVERARDIAYHQPAFDGVKVDEGSYARTLSPQKKGSSRDPLLSGNLEDDL